MSNSMIGLRAASLCCVVSAFALPASPLAPTEQPRHLAIQDNCPAIHGPTANAPDILGMPLGASAVQVLSRLRCLGYQPQFTFNNEVPAMPDGSRPVRFITARRGGESLQIAVAGPNGRGVVVGIQRHVRFREGEEPALAILEVDLGAKYPPLMNRFRPTSPRRGSAAADLSGFTGEARVLTPLAMCHNEHAHAGGDLLVYPDPDCGVLIAADITASARNPRLASSFAVQLSHGALAVEHNNRYLEIAREAIARRRAEELERARNRRPDL